MIISSTAVPEFSSTTNPSSHCENYNYSVKIVNPKKKTDYVIQTLRFADRFGSLEHLKKTLVESCRDKVPSDIEQLGYIEPGHGSKGKLRWLLNDQDIEDMYKVYLRKREILLWCSAREENERAKKRTHSPVSTSKSNKQPRTTKYGEYRDKMTEVESIEEKLCEKHEGRFTSEQYRAWAHLIQLKKHDSLEDPPNKPFWRGSSQKAMERQMRQK